MVKTALALIFSLLVACIATGVSAQQQQNQKKSETTKPARPMWSELSPQQQHVLGPLAADWESLDTTRRKKWVTIANRYPKMKPDAQARLQERMQTWSQLTPEQRRVARETYQTLKQLPPPQRREISQKWQQQLNAPRSDAAQDATPETAPDTTGK